MVSLGIDPSTAKVAVASLADTGAVDHDTYRIPSDVRGARRLRYIRQLLSVELRRFEQVAVIVVEIPWSPRSRGTSFSLMGSAAVLMEAAQCAHHGAVVLELPTQSWKADSVGNGNASKAEVMAHAIGLGLDVDDQDVADALCMAQAGWVAWHKATEVAA